MNVYRMNRCDCVAAPDEAAAKAFYQLAMNFSSDDVNQFYEGPVNLDDSALIPLDDLPIRKRVEINRVIQQEGELWHQVKYGWIIKKFSSDKPYIISSWGHVTDSVRKGLKQ